MRTIDWRKVTQDKELSKEFAVTVHNRFHSLYPNIVLDSENHLEDSYFNLSKITEEIAIEMLPKKEKSTPFAPSTARIVELAREKVKCCSIQTIKIHPSLIESP